MTGYIKIFRAVDDEWIVELWQGDTIIESGCCRDFNELVSYVAYLTAKDRGAIQRLTRSI